MTARPRTPYKTSAAIKALPPAPPPAEIITAQPKRRTAGTFEQWEAPLCEPGCKRERFHFGPCLPFTLEDVKAQPSGLSVYFAGGLVGRVRELIGEKPSELEPLPLIGTAMQRLSEPKYCTYPAYTGWEPLAK